MPMIRLALVLLLAFVVPALATQTQQGLAVVKRWAAMDNCTKQAQAAFPDFTAVENAQREARLQACLEGQNLPSRPPTTPRP
jgi:hypothetical protein